MERVRFMSEEGRTSMGAPYKGILPSELDAAGTTLNRRKRFYSFAGAIQAEDLVEIQRPLSAEVSSCPRLLMTSWSRDDPLREVGITSSRPSRRPSQRLGTGTNPQGWKGVAVEI